MTRLPLPPLSLLDVIGTGFDAMANRIVDGWADALEARFDRERQLRCIGRIRRAFLASAPGGFDLVIHRPFLGLGWWRSGSTARALTFRLDYPVSHVERAPTYPPAPFGWRWLKEEQRNAAVLLPLWLYWPARIRREWPSMLFPALMRLGLWAVNEEGGYYIADGRPTLPLWFRRAWWCFLHDADEAPPPCYICGRLSAEGRYPAGFGHTWWKCIPCIDRDMGRNR
jgi:hypothetical protein